MKQGKLLWLMPALTQKPLLNSPKHKQHLNGGPFKDIARKTHENECLTANENKPKNMAAKNLKAAI